MFGWLKSLFVDEKVRKVPGKAVAKAPARPLTAREKAIAQAKAQAKAQAGQLMTPERAALIQQAMKVHQAKRKILDSLSDEDRARLVAMAITALMGEGRPASDAKPPGKKK